MSYVTANIFSNVRIAKEQLQILIKDVSHKTSLPLIVQRTANRKITSRSYVSKTENNFYFIVHSRLNFSFFSRRVNLALFSTRFIKKHRKHYHQSEITRIAVHFLHGK